ncbi:putative cupin superfamily protein [Alteromonadaceae bacterium 2753L.S.0a.02]|nr:putative cupin superfamily protein [Alteromonadaceae bacterium 2753L.S.0a.02]
MSEKPSVENVVNIKALTYREWGNGGRFEARIGAISNEIGAERLGYNLTVLPPGKCAFPFHNHRVNEEMFFVVSGRGELRFGDAITAITEGDVIACPPGGREHAHQIRNISETDELRYLAVSTRMSPEIAEYPDSDKYGVLGEFPGKAGEPDESLRLIVRGHATLEDYWDGED